MGAGFVAASLLGSLGGQPAGAYQATFNLKVENVPSQTSRTFIDATTDIPGGWVNNTMVMTVGSLSAITSGASRNVTTNIDGVTPNSFGLCVISTTCTGVNTPNNVVQAATFSFSKPIQNFQFTVGNNTAPTELGWGSSVLKLTYGSTSTEIALGGTSPLLADHTYSFPQSILVAAGDAITVGFFCTGSCPATNNGNGSFFISDVIVEAPAPLPLIGTGAAFAWTRRLRRRIKATPSPTSNA
jgi:hypothetical protein